MFKGKRKSYNNGLGVRTIFNNIHEAEFNPVKKFYATVFYDGTSNLVTYESKFRSEAEAYFNEIARLNHGHVETVSTFK